MVFLKGLGSCITNGRIQAEHMNGVNKKALLRKGDSPILPGEEREEEGPGSLGR
jgi:hypothetical protein